MNGFPPHTISRRTALAAIGTWATTVLHARPDAAPQAIAAPGNRQIANSKRLPFGTMVSRSEIGVGPRYRALVERHCAFLTVAGPIYWRNAQPERARFVLADAEEILSFGEQLGLSARAHTLLWHQMTPMWLDDVQGTVPLGELISMHVGEIVGRLRGRVCYWDVLNEPLNAADGRSDGLRTSRWLREGGPRYMDVAFHVAQESDPSALLGINETGLEDDSVPAARRRRDMLTLLLRMRADGVLPHYLGIQGHLAGGQTFSHDGLGTFIERVLGLGVRVLITEMDVSDVAFPADTALRDAAVADVYDRFLSIALGHGAISAVTTWGLTDSRSWLQQYAPRRDGLPQRPLPFDDDFRPKPAWSTIQTHLDRMRQ